MFALSAAPLQAVPTEIADDQPCAVPTKVGTASNNHLYGSTSDDVIVGLGGADRIDGLRGNDELCGGEGNDRLLGRTGNDVLYGEDGNDVLNGGDRDDYIFGGRGTDRIYGGSGNDTIDALDGEVDVISCGSGTDTVLAADASDTVNDDCEDVSPVNNPVELQKVSSGPAIPGSSFDYSIAVGNIGTCTLTNVRVNDVLTGPAGTTILSTEPTSTITPTAGGFNLAFPDVGPIAPNERITLRIRVQVPVDAAIGSRYNDEVAVAADCAGAPFTRTFTLPDPTTEPRPTSGRPCTISGSSKSASHVEAFSDEQIAYFVNLYNSGAQPCTGATITDALDPRLTFTSCSDGCSAAGRTLTWNVGTVAPGQSITFRVVARVNSGATGTLPNTARADTNETGPVDMTTPGPAITGRSILAGNNPAITPDHIR